MPAADPEVLEDLVIVEDARRLFSALGKPIEFWEGLCLVKGDRGLMREEVRRLRELHEAGHAAGVARQIIDRLRMLREQIGPLVRGLQTFIHLVPGAPTDPTIVSMALGFVAISPKGREAASRWAADPARHINEARSKLGVIVDVVNMYRAALKAVRPAPPVMEQAVFKPAVAEPPAPPPKPVELEHAEFGADAPAPVEARPPTESRMKTQASPHWEGMEQSAPAKPVTVPPKTSGVPAKLGDPFSAVPKPPPKDLPPGVDVDILDDVRRVQQCRTVFEVTHQQIEVWEVFCLVMLDPATKPMLDRLIVLRDSDDMEFTDGALALFEKLLDMRAKHGRFVRALRDYIAELPIGHFGKDTMEMALGFIVASPRGRQAAERWVADGPRFKTEAAGRLEDLISKTMNYETALRMIQQ